LSDHVKLVAMSHARISVGWDGLAEIGEKGVVGFKTAFTPSWTWLVLSRVPAKLPAAAS